MAVRTVEELLAKLEILEENIGTYKAEVGATDEDIAEITRDKVILQFMVDRAIVVESGKKTTNAIKDHVFNGDEDIPVASFPVLPNSPSPEPLVGGCLGRYNEKKRRYKAAKGYTNEIGIALGIAETSQSISPESVKPTLNATAAQSGYMVAVVISNRGDSSMWKIFARRANSENRQEIASGTGKSADITISPTTPNQAEKVELTVQLYKSNANYGQVSDAVYVTVSP